MQSLPGGAGSGHGGVSRIVRLLPRGRRSALWRASLTAVKYRSCSAYVRVLLLEGLSDQDLAVFARRCCLIYDASGPRSSAFRLHPWRHSLRGTWRASPRRSVRDCAARVASRRARVSFRSSRQTQSASEQTRGAGHNIPRQQHTALPPPTNAHPRCAFSFSSRGPHAARSGVRGGLRSAAGEGRRGRGWSRFRICSRDSTSRNRARTFSAPPMPATRCKDAQRQRRQEAVRGAEHQRRDPRQVRRPARRPASCRHARRESAAAQPITTSAFRPVPGVNRSALRITPKEVIGHWQASRLASRAGPVAIHHAMDLLQLDPGARAFVGGHLFGESCPAREEGRGRLGARRCNRFHQAGSRRCVQR